MLSTLFNRKPILFEIQINLSKYSNVEILKKANTVNDKEFILLGLLIYARLLRLFRLAKIDSKFAPYTFFLEALKTQSSFQSDAEFLNKLSGTINLMKNTYEKATALKVVCKGDTNSEKLIYTSTPKSKELGCYVYTIYSFVQDNISEKNKLILFQLFAALSNLKMSKEITTNDAINFPNHIINEVQIS